MNGKLNLFIRVIVCFLAYFYSVNAFALTFPAKTQFGTTLESERSKCSSEGVKRYPPPNTGISSTIKKVDAYSQACVVSQNGSEFGTLYSFSMSCNFSGSPDLSATLNDGLCISALPDPPQQCIAGFKLIAADNTCKPDCDNKAGELNASWAAVCITNNAQQDYCNQISGKDKKIAFDVVLPTGKTPGNLKGYCDSGCVSIPTASLRCLNAASVGDKTKEYYSCTAVGTVMGQTCSNDKKEIPPDQIKDPSPAPTLRPEATPMPVLTPKPESNCISQGKSFGTVNGAVVCVSQPKDGEKIIKSDVKSETSKNPDGTETKSTTNTTTITDSIGKTTTNTTKTVLTPNGNKRPGGEICTIPAGCTDVESNGKDESTDEFCKENPTSPMCKDGSVSGGCDGTYKCDGEAAVCEISRVQWLERCEQLKQNSELEKSDLFKDGVEILKGKLDDDTKIKLGLSGDDNTIDISETFKDSSNGFLSCSRGLNDKSFSVFGKSIQLPFSKLNYFLEMMGKIAVIFTMIVSAKIIIGGVK